MSSQTISSPVSDERVLEQLEAEFMRIPMVSLSPSELDLAETLAPAVRRTFDDPVCGNKRKTVMRSRTGGCCD